MGRGIIRLTTRPSIGSAAAIVGKKEADGPLARCFDKYDDTDTFGMPTWEQSEAEMQRLALTTALDKGGLSVCDIDAIFAGDLINQCISSGYGLANFDAPFFGLFGACSTIAEGLILGAMLVDSGKFRRIAAVTSSHNCAAERQFRFPVEYGGQRTPTAQWTVTGSAAILVEAHSSGPHIAEVLPGRVCDMGIRDAANMGAAMAPAAADTLTRYFRESGRHPRDFSAIITGDLGYEGSGILVDLLKSEGIDIACVHHDCGLMMYDRQRQDVHAGGSGCGCCAAVLAGYFIPQLRCGRMQDVLIMATGAMMNTASIQQGLTIPGIAHLLRLTMEENDGKNA
ncbi:MAG: stage V sporulation protein AD [Ruminococcaceae bacterium]|nr:stage V sporulation protein AD [Oscillospiraceae bacterium]